MLFQISYKICQIRAQISLNTFYLPLPGERKFILKFASYQVVEFSVFKKNDILHQSLRRLLHYFLSPWWLMKDEIFFFDDWEFNYWYLGNKLVLIIWKSSFQLSGNWKVESVGPSFKFQVSENHFAIISWTEDEKKICSILIQSN